MSRITLMLSALLLIAGHRGLAASEFNIDFGDLSTSTPASYGAASGQTGIWNIIDTLGPVALVDTSGGATGATLSINLGDSFGSDGNYPGPHADLLNDMLWGQSTQPTGSDWSLTFAGLPAGTYDIYYYAPAHPMPTGAVLINNAPAPTLPGDGLNTALVKGLNWEVRSGVFLPSGILRITGTNSDPNQFVGLGGIAGLQLVQRNRVPIDPPPPGC